MCGILQHIITAWYVQNKFCLYRWLEKLKLNKLLLQNITMYACKIKHKSQQHKTDGQIRAEWRGWYLSCRRCMSPPEEEDPKKCVL